jgi:hypothetical protein
MTPTEQARAALEALAAKAWEAGRVSCLDAPLGTRTGRQIAAMRDADVAVILAREAAAHLEPLGERPADWVGEWVAPTVKPAGKPRHKWTRHYDDTDGRHRWICTKCDLIIKHGTSYPPCTAGTERQEP